MVIYKVTNKINGKIYIGQTVGLLETRRQQHIYRSEHNSKMYFHNALRKYGKDSFKWENVRLCNNINELNVYEQYYILYYDSMNNGYNLTPGGLNRIVSDATKLKMSIAQRGDKNHRYGKKYSEHDKKIMSKNRIGKLNGFYNKKHSIETIKKISKTRIEKGLSKGKNNPMYGKKKEDTPMYGIHRYGKDAPFYGRKHTEESKEKNRQATLKYWKNKNELL